MPTRSEQVRNTLHALRVLRHFKDMGEPVSYTTDVTWLVNMAINRRAGWPDDPTLSRGSAMPVRGQYPPKGGGDYYRHLVLFARDVNHPRLIVRERECPERYRARLAHRLTRPEDDAW